MYLFTATLAFSSKYHTYQMETCRGDINSCNSDFKEPIDTENIDPETINDYGIVNKSNLF